MNPVVLDDIPFEPDFEALSARLRIKPESAHMVDLGDMVDRAREVARPKAIYRVVRVETRGEDHVVLEGTRFTSRVLRVNLGEAHRAFVYVATCGVELEEWVQSLETAFDQFQADAIAGAALATARHACFEQVEELFRPGQLGEMNPGSLQDWPIRDQRPLLDLLGDPEAAIGVELLDSYWMTPTKTTSGLLFPTEDGYYNCQLCPMEACPGRKAPYDQGLYERKYQAST
jgi:hypothetical protein